MAHISSSSGIFRAKNFPCSSQSFVFSGDFPAFVHVHVGVFERQRCQRRLGHFENRGHTLGMRACFVQRVLENFKKCQQSWFSHQTALSSIIHANCFEGCRIPGGLLCTKGISTNFRLGCASKQIRIFSFVKQCNISFASIRQRFYFSTDQKPAVSSGSQVPVPSHSGEHWGPYIVSQLHRLEESSRVHGYSTLRWGLSVIVVLLTCIYLFRDRLRDNVADEVADVASRSMADENVVLKAHGMTKGVLKRLVSETETINLVSEFVMAVLQKDEVRKTAVEFATTILNHPVTQEKIHEITRSTIHAILDNDETRSMLLNFIKNLIEDQQTKDVCNHLLFSLTQDTNIQAMLADFFKSVLASPKLQMEAITLGREVTNQVVHDKNIQKDTGDALWSAVKYGMTPHWFRGEN